jgi:hypothetical protein
MNQKLVSIVAAGGVVVVAVGVWLVARGGDDGEKRAVTGTPSSTSTSVSQRTTTTAPPTPADTPAPVATVGPSPAGRDAEESVAAPVCVSSFDPACGPLHWEPPVGDQPARVDSVLFEPLHPVAGQTVKITITVSDPDADRADLVGWCDGQGCVEASLAGPRCGPAGPPTGAWTAPPSPGGVVTLVHSFVFPTAGAAKWSIELYTRSSAIAALGCFPDPYSSAVSTSGTVEVASAP